MLKEKDGKFIDSDFVVKKDNQVLIIGGAKLSNNNFYSSNGYGEKFYYLNEVVEVLYKGENGFLYVETLEEKKKNLSEKIKIQSYRDDTNVTIGKVKSRKVSKRTKNNYTESKHRITNYVGVRPTPNHGKEYIKTLEKGEEVILLSDIPINNYYKIKVKRKIGYIPTYAISLE